MITVICDVFLVFDVQVQGATWSSTLHGEGQEKGSRRQTMVLDGLVHRGQARNVHADGPGW